MAEASPGGISAAAGPRPALDRSYLPRLTSLRVLAALFVFGYHLQLFNVVAAGRWPLDIGYTGVGFFFVLSGFVLTWGADPTGDRRKFWFNRFARIYPAYAVVLVAAGVIAAPGTPPRTPAGAAAAALLVQSWAPHTRQLVYALNPPAWSLSNEAFFYLALPFVLVALGRLSRRRRLVAAAGWFTLTAALVATAAAHGGHWRLIAFTFPLVRSGEFLLGIVAALEMREGRRLPTPMVAVVGLGSVLAAAVLPGATPLPDLWLDPLWLVVVVGAAQADVTGARGWLLTRRWMVYAGGVSYAFYLVHQDVIAELGRRVGSGPGVAVIALVTAALLAAAVHHGIERPARRLLLGAARTRRPARTPALVAAVDPAEAG